jgi:hypothetical protein
MHHVDDWLHSLQRGIPSNTLLESCLQYSVLAMTGSMAPQSWMRLVDPPWRPTLVVMECSRTFCSCAELYKPNPKNRQMSPRHRLLRRVSGREKTHLVYAAMRQRSRYCTVTGGLVEQP